MRPVVIGLAVVLSLAVLLLVSPLAGRIADRRGAVAILELPVGERYAGRVEMWRAEHEAGIRHATDANPVVADFYWWPVNERYRVVANYIPRQTPTTVPIVDLAGNTHMVLAPGQLEFTLKGETLRLDVYWGPPDDDRLFVIFTDDTNGDESVEGGRYVHAEFPGGRRAGEAITSQAAEGAVFPPIPVVLDFNTAYTPRCAFTRDRTCPVPPGQNDLGMTVEAGQSRVPVR